MERECRGRWRDRIGREGMGRGAGRRWMGRGAGRRWTGRKWRDRRET